MLARAPSVLVVAPNLRRGPATSPGCGECPFAKEGRPVLPVPGEGPVDPKWIAVGEGPGENERRTGRPFVGASGRMLNNALQAVGASRAGDVYITNALLCTPPSTTDAQKVKARECCAPRLRAELAELPGVPILALGAVAAQGFLGDKFSITQMAGALHDVTLGGEAKERVVIPTVHPAMILRGGDEGAAHSVDLLFWNLIYDVGKIHGFARGTLQRFSEDIEIETEDPAAAETLVEGLLRDARRLKFLAVDVETDSLRPLKAQLRAIGLATVERAVSVAWAIVTPRCKRLIGAALANSTIRKGFWNQLYDRPVLGRHAMPVIGPCDDGMLKHHNAFPGLAHDLQRAGTQIFPIGAWKAEFRGNEQATIEDLCRYNGKDALVTARLDAPLTIYVKKSKAERTYEMDVLMAEIAERMHVVGIPIDREVNAGLRARFQAEIDRTKTDLEARAARPEIRDAMLDRIAMEMAKIWRKGSGDKSGRNKSNRPPDPTDFLSRQAVRLRELREDPKFAWKINAPAHLAAYLRAIGAPLYAETEKGKLSTKKAVLDGLGHVEEVRAINEFREAQKMLSTFVTKIANALYADGRIHPRWSVHKITGRWGAEDPMVMNWPKANKRKNRPNLRAQIVAPKGKLFVGFDLAQADARGIALMSGDDWLREVFSHPPTKYGPGDIHTRFAQLVWADFFQMEAADRDKVRDFIKRTEYGGFYAGSIDTLWHNLLLDDPNVKRDDIARVVDVLQRQLTGVARWHEELLRQAATPPHEIREVVLGRRRVFPLGNAGITDVFAFPPQACTASVMALGLSRFWPRRPRRCEIIQQIHDACIFEVDEDQAEKVKELVIETFSQEHEHNGVRVAFPVEAKIGRTGAEV